MSEELAQKLQELITKAETIIEQAGEATTSTLTEDLNKQLKILTTIIDKIEERKRLLDEADNDPARNTEEARRLIEQDRLNEDLHNKAIKRQKELQAEISKTNKARNKLGDPAPQAAPQQGSQAGQAAKQILETFNVSLETASEVAGDGLKKLVEKLKENPALALIAAFGGGNPVRAAAANLKKLPLEIDKVESSFNKLTLQTGDLFDKLLESSRGREAFQRAFAGADAPIGELVDLAVKAKLNLEEISPAIADATSEIALFGPAVIKGNEAQAVSTINLIAVLKKLGADGKDVSGIFNTLNLGLGKNSQETNDFTRSLFSLGKSLGVGTRIFKGAETTLNSLQGASNDVATSFKEIQIQSVAFDTTGERLVALGSKFNKFDEAASAVQSINAVLGEQVLDFTELLQVPVEEKFNVIRQRLSEAGVSFNELNFQAKQIIASKLGFASVGEASKQLSENSQKLYERLKSNADDSIASNDKLTDSITKSRTLNERLRSEIEPRGIAPSVEIANILQNSAAGAEDVLRAFFEQLDNVEDIQEAVGKLFGVRVALKPLESALSAAENFGEGNVAAGVGMSIVTAIQTGMTTLVLPALNSFLKEVSEVVSPKSAGDEARVTPPLRRSDQKDLAEKQQVANITINTPEKLTASIPIEVALSPDNIAKFERSVVLKAEKFTRIQQDARLRGLPEQVFNPKGAA